LNVCYHTTFLVPSSTLVLKLSYSQSLSLHSHQSLSLSPGIIQGRRQKLMEGVTPHQPRHTPLKLVFSPSPSLPSPSHSFSSLSPSFPFPLLRSKAPVNQLEGLGSAVSSLSRGPGQNSGRKRIWCTLGLSKSHWWQSF